MSAASAPFNSQSAIRNPQSEIGNRQSAIGNADESLIGKGRAYFLATCNECHTYAGESSGTIHAPEMRGYGSVEWIERMIENPADDTLYRSTGKEPAQMPAFKDKLTQQERHLLAVWLHGTRLEPIAPSESHRPPAGR
jgi:mono/diheme cytochrome c family protein